MDREPGALWKRADLERRLSQSDTQPIHLTDPRLPLPSKWVSDIRSVGPESKFLRLLKKATRRERKYAWTPGAGTGFRWHWISLALAFDGGDEWKNASSHNGVEIISIRGEGAARLLKESFCAGSPPRGGSDQHIKFPTLPG